MHGQTTIYDVVTEHVGHTTQVLHCPTRQAQQRVKRALLAQGYSVTRLTVVKVPAAMLARMPRIDAPGEN